MGLSSVELWQRIAASQLASPLLCRTWAADAASALSASEALDGASVGQQLVNQGKLTRFQIDNLLSDAPLPLVRHGYRLLEPVNYTPYPAPHARCIWNDWWVVAKTPTSPSLWMRWLQVDDLKQAALAQSNPALPRALQQSQVRDERLQAIQPPEMAGGTLQLCVEPIDGQLLSGSCDGRPKPMDAVIKLLKDAAAALAPLHSVGLAHGRVTPDRICLNAQGQYQLLRDPLCGATLHMAAGKAQAASGLLAAQLPVTLDAVHFMAPEFLLPAQVATPQSDLYGLGCVAWLLLTGNPPFVARQPEQVMAAHAEQPLDESKLSTIPAPLWRCLAHCLAKNPSARFQQATQLVNALQEAERIVARGPSAQPKKDQPVAKPATVVSAAAIAPSGEAQPSKAADVKTVKPVAAPVASEAKTVEAKAVEAKAVEAKSVEAKPVEAKPVEAKPVEAKPVDAKAVEAKPVDAKTVDAKTVDAKTNSKPAASSTAARPVVPVARGPVAPAAASPVENKSSVAASSARTPTTSTPTTTPTSPAIVPAVTTSTAVPAAATAPTPSTTAPTPVAATASNTPASPTQKRQAAPGKPPGRRSPVRKSKKSNKVNWLTPVIGGGGLLVLILIVVMMSGGLGNSSRNQASATKGGGNNSTATNGSTAPAPVEPPAPVDPLADKFELVSDVPTALWAPPRIPEPLQFNLLPPGGQFFAGLRPAKLMAQSDAKQLLSLLDADLNPLWKSIADTCGLPVEQIEQVVLAAYPAENGGPQVAMRVQLKEGQMLSALKSKWQAPVDTKVKEQSLLVSGPRAFYVAQQPFVDSQSVTEFSVGPETLMRDVAESHGDAATMSGQMEQLRQATDRAADINLLVNPVFFYTEGRAWLETSPPRFRSELERWMSRDLRAAMLSTSFGDQWYYELRLVGSSDREAVVNSQKLNDARQQLPQTIESWLVNELPHPHWRAMANRFPNMLRAFSEQTRVGAENGQAIVNGYLPMTAAPNLIYASWMAVQPGSTASGGAVVANTPAGNSEPALTPEQILDRKITLTIDQTGIENVLQAIGEQANEKLPGGTKPLRFELDGAGFQRSGITRNQQIKDFQVKDQTVREALILLSKKGNPVQPLNDLKSDDQKLIWVVVDPSNPDKAFLSLTSREAAIAAGHKLPAEFVK